MTLPKEAEDSLVRKMKEQGRLAYDVCKALKRQTDKKVSYIVKHQILLDNQDIRILTSIEELPHIHVGHGLNNVKAEYCKEVDIDNIDD